VAGFMAQGLVFIRKKDNFLLWKCATMGKRMGQMEQILTDFLVIS
jgi:hypothetical protein